MKRFAAIVVLMAVAPLGAAQQKSVQAGPADPKVTVPSVKYESPFASYVPYREQELLPWRGVNDEVGRIGGHIGIVRNHGTSAPGKPAAKPPAASTAPQSQTAPVAKPDSRPGPAQDNLRNP